MKTFGYFSVTDAQVLLALCWAGQSMVVPGVAALASRGFSAALLYCRLQQGQIERTSSKME